MDSQVKAVELEGDREMLLQELREDIEDLITFEAIVARDRQELDSLFGDGSPPSIEA
jgi:hypothetical protein